MVTISASQIRQSLDRFEFRELFNDLGWDRLRNPLTFDVDGQPLTLEPVAQKRGFVVYVAPPDGQGRVPLSDARRKIERQLAQRHHEHLLIFADAGRTEQVWLWVREEPKRPLAVREVRYDRQKRQDLLQRLQALAFGLEEEATVSTVEVAGRVKRAFDVEKVTKKFYNCFKTEHDELLKLIRGIPDNDPKRWYASVMINRLMFVYFIQKKGLLGGDLDYLQHQLAASQRRGPDQFYRGFLRRLFFEGFAVRQEERTAEIDALLGPLPYLSGSIFTEHQIEAQYGQAIALPDAVFERLFAFFDGYQWHLDDRPSKADDEINPDVLGYIFEKYINQKQMGAYYTKEDITGYIARNTVIPFLLDRARRDCKVAFEGPQSVWRLLQAEPDRYIYPALRHGLEHELPPNIAAGIASIPARAGWNRPALEPYALPTETWREVVARRQRAEALRAKLAAGEVQTVDDLITLNLDVRQFAQDVLESWEGSDLIRACWRAIREITVLDPTCGSGAFLFAALEILEPLYEACLQRMEQFVDDLDRTEGTPHPAKHKAFRDALAEVARHPNRAYFVYKSIVVHNLYGVDLMEEAVEICKLRLFLKLVAQVEPDDQQPNFGIEALPDIDFNIQAGNTLVGFVTQGAVRQALKMKSDGQTRLVFAEDESAWEEILERIENTDRAFSAFQLLQTSYNMDPHELAEAKTILRARRAELDHSLNGHLARQNGVEQSDSAAYRHWLQHHKPLHWFVDFYRILARGGFDVVIGNPPYVAMQKIDYSFGLATVASFPDIYAYVILRCLELMHHDARFGMIVPLSVTFSSDFGELRSTLLRNRASWFSSYDNIPDAVFTGVSQRCTIVISREATDAACFSSPMYRWRSEFRDVLVSVIGYSTIPRLKYESKGIPKVGSDAQADLIRLLLEKAASSPAPIDTGQKVSHLGFSQTARNYASTFIEAAPCLDERTRKTIPSAEVGTLPLNQTLPVLAAMALTCGDIFFWYWLSRGDGFHVIAGTGRDFLHAVAHEDRWVPLLEKTGHAIHEYRYAALVFKRNAGKYVGSYNYRRVSHLTRRADLLTCAKLGLTKTQALDLLEYVARVLAVNAFAGEKGIPTAVKERFPGEFPDVSTMNKRFAEVDHTLVEHYGLTAEELDYLVNYDDVKYRPDHGGGEGEE